MARDGGVEMELVTPTGMGGGGQEGRGGERVGTDDLSVSGGSLRSGSGRDGKDNGVAADDSSWSPPTRGDGSRSGSPHKDLSDDNPDVSGSDNHGDGDCNDEDVGDGDYCDADGDRGDGNRGDARRRPPRERGGGSGSGGGGSERRRRDNWTEQENEVFVDMVTAHLDAEEMDLRRMLARHFAPRRTHEQCANHLRILRNTGKLPRGNPIV